MAKKMETYYNEKCNDDIRKCLNCSYNACSNTLPPFECLTLNISDSAC